MNSLGWIILGGLLMSAIALVGSVTAVLRPVTLNRLLLPLVSLAAGACSAGPSCTCFPQAFRPLAPSRRSLVAGRFRHLSRT